MEDCIVDWPYLQKTCPAHRFKAEELADAQFLDELEAYKLPTAIGDRCLAAI